jgi:hypothetical protein
MDKNEDEEVAELKELLSRTIHDPHHSLGIAVGVPSTASLQKLDDGQRDSAVDLHRRRMREDAQKASLTNRRPWDFTPFHQTPAALKGLDPVTTEPWARDAEIYEVAHATAGRPHRAHLQESHMRMIERDMRQYRQDYVVAQRRVVAKAAAAAAAAAFSPQTWQELSVDDKHVLSLAAASARSSSPSTRLEGVSPTGEGRAAGGHDLAIVDGHHTVAPPRKGRVSARPSERATERASERSAMVATSSRSSNSIPPPASSPVGAASRSSASSHIERHYRAEYGKRDPRKQPRGLSPEAQAILDRKLEEKRVQAARRQAKGKAAMAEKLAKDASIRPSSPPGQPVELFAFNRHAPTEVAPRGEVGMDTIAKDVPLEWVQGAQAASVAACERAHAAASKPMELHTNGWWW